jgi:hypothetical protein
MARIKPRTILVAACTIFFAYAYPGFLSNDQEDSLLQSRTGVYEDMHPPVIALLWRICEFVMTGPVLLLVAQTLTFVSGMYLLARRRLSDTHAAIVAAGTLLFPPMAGVLGVASGKDALMFGFILLGLALAMSERALTRRIGVALLILGTAVRWNALAATAVPVVLLYETGRTGWRRYAMSVAVWLAITASAFGLNGVLADRPKHMWYGTHAYEDIAGTLAYVDDIDDATLVRTFDETPLVKTTNLHRWFKEHYNCCHYVHLHYGPDRVWDYPTTSQQRVAIARAWRAIVLGHPGAYLHYRWDNFRLLTSLDRPDMFSNVYIWFHQVALDEVPDSIEHDASPSRIQDMLRRAEVVLSKTPLFWVFPYVLICLVLIPFALRDRYAFAFLASALGYEAAWFVLAPTSDLRYSAWLWPCIALAGVFIIARRFKMKSATASTHVVMTQ